MSSIIRILWLSSLFLLNNVYAQDPEFSQFFAAPVYTNPAFAGANLNGRVSLNYRNQWSSLPGTFRTFSGAYDEHFDQIGGGIGIVAMQDVSGQGLLSTTTLSGIYSYLLKVNTRFNIKLGIESQYFQRSIDFEKLRWGDQIVKKKGFVTATTEPNPSTTIGIPNFAAGFVAFTRIFYFGGAVHNITEPNQSFYKTPGNASNLPRRYTVQAGMNLPLSRSKYSNSAISPALIIMRQREFTQISLGFYASKGPLVLGALVRQTAANSDALTFMAGFRSGKFKFGYSFDFTISEGYQALKGSHEISAVIEWNRRSKSRSVHLVCPRIW
jgi:type IX secretion system PorP/SprF family membrane protein